MSSSSLSSRLCFNAVCSEINPKRFRPGWRLRNGDFADLCDRCASAYIEGKFCDMYHLNASGWRNCESCGKRIHCGCIASASAFMVLDAGGVECLACSRKKASLGASFSRPPSFFFQPPIAEKFKDLSVKNWSSSVGSGQMNYWRPSNLLGPSVLQFDQINRGSQCELGQSTFGDKLSSMEKQDTDEFPGKLTSGSPKFHTNHVENGKGSNREEHNSPTITTYQLLNSLNEDPCGPQLPFPVNETNGHVRLAGSHLHQAPYLHNDLNSGVDSLCDSENQNMRPHVGSRGKHRVLPRYWPRFTDQDLQNLSSDSKSSITPLFEKMLSASDAGRIGRLVLPKKCAEAYLPQISQPEGLPLKVQDSTGKEWIFQFRFWPNNNSRMYVLEGVTACIQSMQLQAGDTVTFSRLDPEGKLIMGFRKASVSQPSDQENESTKSVLDAYTNGDEQAEPADHHPLSKVCKSAFTAKEGLAVKSSSRKKKKTGTKIVKGKRRSVEKEDLKELNLTWEEAQGLLQPHPNNVRSVIVIEGYEFEEYEDAPIIGKPTVFASDASGSPYPAVQELGSEQLDDMLFQHNLASSSSKALKSAKEETCDMETVEEMDTVGKLGLHGESGEGLVMSSKSTTTKHPRHRPGCTCIVCIQPPSGKGPKHEQSCVCTVCQMVKRRFRTLMQRREKKQTEKEETSSMRPPCCDEEQLHQCDYNNGIDLNIQPERDEESPLPSASQRPLCHEVTMEDNNSAIINQANSEEGER